MLLRPLLVLACALCVITAARASAQPLADLAAAVAGGKLSQETRRKVEAGELNELLVHFDDATVNQAFRAHLAQRGLAVPDEAARTFRADRLRLAKQAALADLRPGETLIRDYRHIPMGQVRLNDAAGLRRLLARKDVLAVFEDMPLKPFLTQSLPLIGQTSVAQTMGRTGTGTSVAVLDTGVNYTRGEFGACAQAGGACKVSVAFDQTKTKWRSDLQPCRAVAAYDDGQTDDASGHGTRVAGVAIGVAPGAKIIAIDVFNATETDLTQTGTACSSDVIDGINWAIANKSTYNIAAINMSLGGSTKYTSPCSGDLFAPAVTSARDNGLLTIIASGNDGYTDGLSSPACVPGAVSVGATYDAQYSSVQWGACTDTYTSSPWSLDKVTCFSNSANYLTLLAPGALLDLVGTTSNGGTSFAAPHVAGAVAVLKAAFPTETPDQIQTRLTSTGKSVTDSRNGIVKPRLDLLAAQGAPNNDAFANALALSGQGGQAKGWNLNASKEAGEPNHAGNGGGKSVWWQWTAPASGTLSLDTHGSAFDTLLGLYTGAGVSSLGTVASNDNDGGAGNTSGLSASVAAGTTYTIAVDGKSGASGAATLNWSLRQSQEITFPALPDQTVNTSLTLAATASSGLTVSYSSQTPATCGMAGNVLSLIAGGTCTVNADQAGNASYLPAPSVSRSFTVNKLTQGISFPVIADQTLGSAPFGVTASADSGLTVEIATLTSSVCAVGGGQVTLLATGTCSLQATQAGDGVYQAATAVARSFSVLPNPSGGGNDGDVPLPPWAMLLLGAGLATAMLANRKPGRGRAP